MHDVPSAPTRNILKFHAIADTSPQRRRSQRKTACVSVPLTATFSQKRRLFDERSNLTQMSFSTESASFGSCRANWLHGKARIVRPRWWSSLLIALSSLYQRAVLPH